MTMTSIPGRKYRRQQSCAADVRRYFLSTCVLSSAFTLTSHADAAEAKMTPWQPGQVMDVRVINAQTKEAIPGVKLELQNAGPGINFQDIKVQTTDAKGEAKLKLPDRAPNAVRVYPTKPGFVPLRVIWEAEPSPVMPKSITIPLEPGKPFGGTIQNEEGKPIPDVKVSVHYWATGSGKNPHIRANIDANTTTDKDGRWHLDIMPAEVDKKELRIFVTHPDYISDHPSQAVIPLPVTEQPPMEELFKRTAVMVMQKGQTIEGRVVDNDGRPIAKANIYNQDYYWFPPKKPTVQTDSDGKFRITGVKPVPADRYGPGQSPRRDAGETIITVEAAGYAPELLDASRSTSPVDIQLKPGKRVQGRVIDTKGKPVKGASVYARTWHAYGNRLHKESKSDAEGNFELTDAPLDAVEYDISKDGYIMVESFPMSPAAERHVVTLKPELRIVGSVVDADTGKPLGKFSFLQGIDYDDGRAPFWERHTAKTISNGRYAMTIRQEGFGYRVRVEADGYMPAESRIFRAYQPDEGEVTYDFKLNKAAPLTGTVHDPDDNPLAGADVYLATEQLSITNSQVGYEGSARHVKTDNHGRFEFPPEVEPFCLIVVHEKGVAMITEKEFDSSEPLQIEEWSTANSTLQISRRPAKGQFVNFPRP